MQTNDIEFIEENFNTIVRYIGNVCNNPAYEVSFRSINQQPINFIAQVCIALDTIELNIEITNMLRGYMIKNENKIRVSTLKSIKKHRNKNRATYRLLRSHYTLSVEEEIELTRILNEMGETAYL